MPQGVDFMFGYIEIQTNEKPRSCEKLKKNYQQLLKLANGLAQ